MYSPQFLFVNESPSSTATPEDKSRRKRMINRHAQIHTIISRLTSPSTASQNPVVLGSLSGQARNISTAETDADRRKVQAVSPSGQQGVERRRESISQSSRRSPSKLSHSPSAEFPNSPTSQVTSEEPGEDLSVALDDQEFQYLQFYLSVAHDKLLRAAGLMESEREEPMLKSAAAMIRACLENDLLMYALLANMSTMLPEMEVDSGSSGSTYYCYKAVEALRHRLSTSDPPDESVIVGLWHLISAEANRGDFDAALTHFEGAKSICTYLERSGRPLSRQYVALIQACESPITGGASMGHDSSASTTIPGDGGGTW